MICGPIDVFSANNFAASIPPSLVIFISTAVVCVVSFTIIFLLT
jgi:hypothetical protein